MYKRQGTAMVKIAMDLLHEGMIDEKTAIPVSYIHLPAYPAARRVPYRVQA